MDPATTAAITSAGADVVGRLISDWFGDDASDRGVEAIEAARRAGAVGTSNASTLLADATARAREINQPGVDTYNSTLRTLNDLLTTGRVANPDRNLSGLTDYIGKQRAAIQHYQRQLTNNAALFPNVSGESQAQITAGNAVLNRNINAAKANIQRAQQTLKTAQGRPGSYLTVSQWMERNDPGYLARGKMVSDAMWRNAAARGGRGGTRALREVGRHLSDYASTEFDKTIEKQLRLAGLGSTAAGRQSNAELGLGTGLANVATADANDYGNSLLAAGQVRAGEAGQQADNWNTLPRSIYDIYRRSANSGGVS